MTLPRPFRPLTVALHPTARGFGWAALASPLAPYDGGLFEARTDKNAVCLRKIEALLDRLEPEAVVLEAFEKRNSARTDRIARLCRAVVAIANGRGIEFAIYTRLDIEAAFAPVGARTRQEIAEAVARHLPALHPRLPPKRKAWDGEDRRMALFSAAALVLTHYRHQAQTVFDDLRDAA